MHSNRFPIALPILALSLLLPHKATAKYYCPGLDPSVAIEAASSLERTLVCDGVTQAMSLLDQCTISLQPSIDIRILNEVRHPFAGPIFGYYDLEKRYIALTRFANLPALMQDTPYAGISPLAFYKSLVVHEIVHAVTHQQLGERVRGPAAYEYPAYALQIASLPPAARARFMEAFDRERLERPIPFTDTILAYAPYFFAARAYTDYVTSSDGCLLVREAMIGERDVSANGAR